ncbi:thiaminase II [soil metagenome]
MSTPVQTHAPSTTEELRLSSLGVWNTLIEHPFPRGVADGTLAPERFRFYITQNLLYLPDYARMLAVGASRSKDTLGLEEFSAAITNIVSVEMPENERLRAAVVELAGHSPHIELVRAPATVAYTSWLLSLAATGDSNDIAAALLPCAWSYGVIATNLKPVTVAHPVYTDWIGFFSSDAYASVVTTLRTSFDRELQTMTEAARVRAADIFLTGCRLEKQFWDQGFNRIQWPDIEMSTL